MRTAAAIALGAVTGLALLAGCTAPAPTAMPVPVPTASSPTPIPPSGDGVLRIGTIASLSGASAAIGAAQVAAVEIAVRDLTAAGGVLGAPVEVVHRDAGDASSDRAETSFADLVARGVDVVIGPPDSALVERLAPLAAEAGVTLLVPGATTAAVGAADTGDVLFRVTPPLTAQVAAIGRALATEGAASIALIVADDAEGVALGEALRAALDGADAEVIATEPLDGATRAAAYVRELLDPEAPDDDTEAPPAPDAVIVATSAELAPQTAAVLEALREEGLEADAIWLAGASLADYADTVAPGVLEGAHGVRDGVDVTERFRAVLRQSDPALESFRYAPETYDAVILAALAAEAAGDDGGPSIAGSLRAVASGGVSCTSFGACLDVIAQDRDPDYDGVTGFVSIDGAGDVVDARLALFRYTAQNSPEREGVLGEE